MRLFLFGGLLVSIVYDLLKARDDVIPEVYPVLQCLHLEGQQQIRGEIFDAEDRLGGLFHGCLGLLRVVGLLIKALYQGRLSGLLIRGLRV